MTAQISDLTVRVEAEKVHGQKINFRASEIEKECKREITAVLKAQKSAETALAQNQELLDERNREILRLKSDLEEKVKISERPVALPKRRANLMSPSLASAPLLQKKIFPAPVRSTSRFARSAWGLVR